MQGKCQPSNKILNTPLNPAATSDLEEAVIISPVPGGVYIHYVYMIGACTEILDRHEA